MTTNATTPPDDESSRLSARLDEQRDALERLPGVTGSGVGFAKSDAQGVVIQVFVASPDVVDDVETQARRILGEHTPVEAVFLPPPAAEESPQGGEA